MAYFQNRNGCDNPNIFSACIGETGSPIKPLLRHRTPLEQDAAPLELDAMPLELDVTPLELDAMPLELGAAPLRNGGPFRLVRAKMGRNVTF